MKKTVRILAFTLVFVMLAMTLASCGAPKSDPDEAKKALEKNGYTVLKTNGYLSNLGAAILGTESNVDASISAYKEVEDKDGNKTSEVLFIIYYKTEAAAKEAWEDAKKDAEDAKKDSGSSDWVVNRSGKMIYYGTKAAVKAAS